MARGMQNQVQQIKKESTPGTANTTAMIRLSSMKLRPGWDGEADPFKGGSSKVPTSVNLPDEIGRWSVDGIQDFAHIGLVLASRFSLPTTTTPGGGTNSRQHVFSILPDVADTFATYTLQFGDATQAIQSVYSVFNELMIRVVRGRLEFGTAIISRAPSTGITLAAGTTNLGSVPIPPLKWDVWADDTWAGLGTTKLLAAYDGNINLGPKFNPDSPINSTVVSFESLVESQDQDHSFDLRLGFDAAAIGLMTTFGNGAMKYFRFKVTGPIAEAAIPYSLQLDFPALILSRGEIGPTDNGTVSVPLTMTMAKDPVTGNGPQATLVNMTLTY